MRFPLQEPTLRLAARGGAAAPKEPSQERAAAQRLEGLFATLLVKEMRASHSSGIFGEGTGADVYGGWFDQFLGDTLAKHGELHLADSIEHSLAKKETLRS